MAQQVKRFQRFPLLGSGFTVPSIQFPVLKSVSVVSEIAVHHIRYLFLAQKASASLVIAKNEAFLISSHSTMPLMEEKSMKANKMKIACVLILCLGMTISSISVLAQKSSPASTEKINLNTATLEQLQTLPGIGPVIAKSIIDHRTKAGKFSRIEEIINVKGIGEKKFQKIRDRLIL
jgi:comEA protein